MLAMATYHGALRESHLKTLASALTSYRRSPYAAHVRRAIVHLCAHKRTPATHSIWACLGVFEEEALASAKLQRQYRGLLARRSVAAMRADLAGLRERERGRAGVVIQCSWRCRRARDEAGERKGEAEFMEAFALKLQKLWRNKVQRRKRKGGGGRERA